MLLSKRRTPWDVNARRAHFGEAAYAAIAELGEFESPCQFMPRKQVICLRGLYIFDAVHSTREDLHRFMWAGLRVLRSEAGARGFSDEEVRTLLSRSFEAFDDAADSIWIALKSVIL